MTDTFQKDENIKYFENARTEEIQDILERMPSKFGYIFSSIVFVIFTLLVLFGSLINYPDIVTGQITINANIAPIKLIANYSGQLRLKVVNSQQSVKTDQIIAYIQNATPVDTIEQIKNIIEKYIPSSEESSINLLQKLPSKVALGELTIKYYALLNNLHQIENFKKDKLYEKQINNLNDLLLKQQEEISNIADKIKIGKNNESYIYKFYKRDSILFDDKIVAESDLDQAKINHLASISNYQNIYSSYLEQQKQLKVTQEQISEAEIQKTEKEKEINLSISSSINDLKDNITSWEQKYVFKCPFNGKVQFLRFWTDGQFVQSGESIFSIVPEQGDPYGQLILPSLGAGKIKIGQPVIIKLDDYPYIEYGIIKGSIKEISLTTNTEKTLQGATTETYLITVNLNNGLITNYGKRLDFKRESKGTAEVITHNKKLIQRFFDNLKSEAKNRD